MSRPKLTQKQWREVRQIRARAREGLRLGRKELALLWRAYKADPNRYETMLREMFNAAFPRSNVRR